MSEQSNLPEIYYLPTSAIESQLGFLQGEVLTLADSSFVDKNQCKAFKDLVKQFFRSRLRYMGTLAYGVDQQACGNANANQPVYVSSDS